MRSNHLLVYTAPHTNQVTVRMSGFSQYIRDQYTHNLVWVKIISSISDMHIFTQNVHTILKGKEISMFNCEGPESNQEKSTSL